MKFDLALPSDTPFGVVEVELVSDPTGVGYDNVAKSHLVIEEAPEVLIVTKTRNASQYVSELLTAEGFNVSIQTTDEIPERISSDLVVLIDTPTSGNNSLPEQFVVELDEAVRRGVGLVVIGGESSFDLGGWHESPLSDLLPVKIDPDGTMKDEATTLVIVMDKSGSMSQSASNGSGASDQMLQNVTARLVGGNPDGSKIEMANAGAIATLDLLGDADRIGVLTVDTLPRWAVEVDDIEDPVAIRAQIASIEAGGGGIFLTTALVEAVDSLRSSDTPIRHLVLFTDAADVGEQQRVVGSNSMRASDVAAEMANDGITLSVIGIGTPSSRDAAYLEALASRGGGRFHLTNDPTQLPALFVQETQTLLGSGVDDAPFSVINKDWHRVLEGLDESQMPPMQGRNIVLSRDRARTLITTESGDPILATWRVGLGEVFSFSAHLNGSWTEEWHDWTEHDVLWTQVFRAALPLVPQTESSVQIIYSSDGPRVKVTRRDLDGMSVGSNRLRLRFQSDENVWWSDPVALAPGEWLSSTFDGTQQLVVQAFDGEVLLATEFWVPSELAEFSDVTVDEDTLDQLSVMPAGNLIPKHTVPLWVLFAVLSALCLPFDAYCRRLV